MAGDEEPEFIEPDFAQRIIYHRWRAAWIEDEIEQCRILQNTWARLRAQNEEVGSVSSLNLRVERTAREKAMLTGWLLEEQELERQARLSYEFELKGRDHDEE